MRYNTAIEVISLSDMFDYLQWRGDILFSEMPVNNVDSLIFSSLAYVQFDDVVTDDLKRFTTLREASHLLFSLPDWQTRCRVHRDLELLQAAAETERFGRVGMTFYQNIFIPEEETQFSAITFITEDGTAFLAFRGTDNSLVGWKEDFNMSFQESVPAQRLAREYVESFAAASHAPMRLGGHSKGGNLAVYAGAKSSEVIQNRILQVFNHDGPGFSAQMMTDPGYLRIVPKIKTFVPQSSVFGMLLEHEEPYTIIRSNQIGLMQHDPYTWEVMGRDFITVEELTTDSRFLDRTFKTWLAGMTNQERNEFFDAVFDLLMMENANRPRDIIRPQNIRALFKTMHMDETKRRMIASVLIDLVESARSTHSEMNEEAAQP